MAFIVDPYNYDIITAVKEVTKQIGTFLDINSIPHPKVELNETSNKGSYGAYYSNSNKIILYPKNTKPPVKTPGYAWSYTGYKSDCTFGGVFAHELGHYIDYYYGRKLNSYQWSVKAPFVKDVLNIERPVSGYVNKFRNKNTKYGEATAEMFKLFILNPDLLKQGRPHSYNMIVNNMKLQPVVSESWEYILQNAHPKLINAAKNWIGNPKENYYDISGETQVITSSTSELF
jgi:hypothetical protein